MTVQCNLISVRNLSARRGQILPLDQLLREGRASKKRIDKMGTGIRRYRKAVLIEWLAQAERLWIAAEIHGLKNIRFQVFARQIGVDRPSAYEVLKLHPHRRFWPNAGKINIGRAGGSAQIGSSQTLGPMTQGTR